MTAAPFQPCSQQHWQQGPSAAAAAAGRQSASAYSLPAPEDPAAALPSDLWDLPPPPSAAGRVPYLPWLPGMRPEELAAVSAAAAAKQHPASSAGGAAQPLAAAAASSPAASAAGSPSRSLPLYFDEFLAGRWVDGWVGVMGVWMGGRVLGVCVWVLLSPLVRLLRMPPHSQTHNHHPGSGPGSPPPEPQPPSPLGEAAAAQGLGSSFPSLPHLHQHHQQQRAGLAHSRSSFLSRGDAAASSSSPSFSSSSRPVGAADG